MKLYPGTEHLLVPVACGDPFVDIRVACGDALLEGMLNLNDGAEGEPAWPFTFNVPYRERENIFAYAFPVAGQHVHVTEFGTMPSRRRLVAAFLACGARHVTYRTADEQLDFYPEDFDEVMYGRQVREPRAPTRRAA